MTKYPYKNAPVNGAWEWQDLAPDWQEEICWLEGITNPTGNWDWSALEEDWAEKMNYTLLWREYWGANYAGWYGWPLSWNEWDPTKPHRLPEPPNYSHTLEENWDDDYVLIEEEERCQDYIAWLAGNPRVPSPDQEINYVEYIA